MAAETTVGSIVGYLRMNTADWDKKAAELDAYLKKLGYTKVNIPVDVDAAQAKRDLEETAAEADALDRKKVDVKVRTDQVKTARKDVNLLGAALVGLAPAAVPLTAAAAALGTSFVGMGATAALAVYGINQEMKSGTAVGQAYSEQIGSLKDDLDVLSHTAASGVLRPFQSVVAQVRQSLPELNRDLAGLASITGDVAVPAMAGIVSALRTANPLFLAGGAAMRDMAREFDQFARSQGFEDFVSYAAANLPRVIDDVEHVAAAAIRLGAAFAPMGMTTLSTLRMVAEVIEGMPIGVLRGDAGRGAHTATSTE